MFAQSPFHQRLLPSPLSSLPLYQAANPFFKLLTMLMEFAGGPPGMPSFASYILQRIWEVSAGVSSLLYAHTHTHTHTGESMCCGSLSELTPSLGSLYALAR